MFKPTFESAAKQFTKALASLEQVISHNKGQVEALDRSIAILEQDKVVCNSEIKKSERLKNKVEDFLKED